MTLFSGIACVALVLYGGLVVWLVVALTRPVRQPTRSEPLPGISVVIPFRNEADNLAAMLTALMAQEYPAQWEIILVNDGSTDNFRAAIASLESAAGGRIRLIDCAEGIGRSLTSKQRAIETGMGAARHDLVALTDADMQFDKQWLYSLAQSSENADLVFGHTEIDPKATGLLASLQRFQLGFLFATAYAFSRAGLAGSCMGNNLLVRKAPFLELGGFDSLTGYSIVEDRDLLAAFHRHDRPIRPVEPFAPLAATHPAPTIAAYLDQLMRWTRGGFSLRSGLLPIGILFSAQNLLFAASLVHCGTGPVAIISFVNMFLTILYVAVGFKRTRSGQSPWFFPAWYLFVLFETVAFPIMFIVRPRVVWKERRV